MSFQAKRELLAQTTARYQAARPAQKTKILDEFVAATGYTRKYAIRVLRHPPPVAAAITRPRAPRYGPPVQAALHVAWEAANGICGKRLVPFLPELVPALERHGHLALTDEVRAQLLTLSAATADRFLARARRAAGPRGIATTKPGALLKRQVPLRTFAGWDDATPGFVEADLVAHCGPQASGAFLHTLVLTDVATGWTECLPLLTRSHDAVIGALDQVRQLLPFPLVGLDTDNGPEFLNYELLGYCERERITFTRGRAYHKNDQCFVEQKNGVIVRQLVGYDRFAGAAAYRQLAEVYRALRLYVNFFQPSMKLLEKQRDGSALHRRYRSRPDALAAPACQRRPRRAEYRAPDHRLSGPGSGAPAAAAGGAARRALAARRLRQPDQPGGGAPGPDTRADGGLPARRLHHPRRPATARGHRVGAAALPADAEVPGAALVAHPRRPVRRGLGHRAGAADGRPDLHRQGPLPGVTGRVSRALPRPPAAHAPTSRPAVARHRAPDLPGHLARGGSPGRRGERCGGGLMPGGGGDSPESPPPTRVKRENAV